jgi:hypothetical protein
MEERKNLVDHMLTLICLCFFRDSWKVFDI